MAGASCLYCELGRIGLKWTVGNTHEPFGVCRNCQTFACGHHGQRDHHVPEYMCVECVAPKLAASAVSWMEADLAEVEDTTELVLGLHALYRPPTPLVIPSARGAVPLASARWAYASFEDFLQRSPGFDDEAAYSMQRRHDYSLRARYASLKDRSSWQASGQRFKHLLGERGFDLLLAAVAVVDVLQIPPERTPKPLNEVRRELT